MHALTAVLAILSAGLGLFVLGIGPAARVGIIDHQTGITLLLTLGAPVAVACLSSLFSVGLATWRVPSLLGLTILCLVPSLIATAGLLMMKVQADAHPFIHDITTDPDNPPMIVAGADAPRANPPGYDQDAAVPNAPEGVTLYEAQEQAFPAIKPVTLKVGVEQAQALVEAALRAEGLEIISISDVEGNPDAIRVEAVARSRWFGFIDDVVVRIDDLSNTESRIDIRSKSRIGLSDLGANGNRVLALIERLSPPDPDS